ncbi:MAG: SDR family NAD(P)-dependent oxidoreductase [Deltaproteobacteria bacterium]|nr:SDR family NAD(P)-dependent oxidoreductase [Deltaproteobacteria bacterium]
MKHCIVTGANAGIGLAIAESLAHQGHAVWMVCRNQARGEAALERVRAQAEAGAQVELVQGDLATVATARETARALSDACPRIDVLIHNAGLWPTARTLNAEGFEAAFAVNHLAPFVLNAQLRPKLEATGNARIVQVTAGLYPMGRIDEARTPFGDDFGSMRTYANTKLWNLLSTLELSRRVHETDLAVLAVHPGVIRTRLGDQGHWAAPLMRAVKLLWSSPAKGARGPVAAALDPELDGVKGAYFDKTRRADLAPVACDLPLAERLWARTEALLTRARDGDGDHLTG